MPLRWFPSLLSHLHDGRTFKPSRQSIQASISISGPVQRRRLPVEIAQNCDANNFSLTDVCGVPKPVQVGAWIALIERARITSAGLSETAAQEEIPAPVKRLSGWRSDRGSVSLFQGAWDSDCHCSCHSFLQLPVPSHSSMRRAPDDSSKLRPYIVSVYLMFRCQRIFDKVK